MNQLEEQELIVQLRSAGGMTDQQKLVAYFERNPLWTRVKNRLLVIKTNEYVRKAFGLGVLKMQKIREALEAEGLVTTERRESRLHILYWRNLVQATN